MSVSQPAQSGKGVAAGEEGWRERIVAEVASVLREQLRAFDPVTTSTLAGIERHTQRVMRAAGSVYARGLAQRAVEDCPRPTCEVCGHAMEVRNRRGRHVCGVQADLDLHRTEYACRSCGTAAVPADVRWQLGPGLLSPELSRVAARAGVEIPSFERAAALISDIIGTTVTADTLGRTSEAIGAVVEADWHAEMASPTVPPPSAPLPAEFTLVVGADATKAHAGGRWRDVKVGVVTPLFPTPPRAGDPHVTLLPEPRTYCAAITSADDFFDRLLTLARRAGWHPDRRMQVLFLGDGGPWLWARASLLRAAGCEPVEILDIYHAREYIWDVAHSVFRRETQAATWAAPLCETILDCGATPVLDALRALRPRGTTQRKAVRLAIAYFSDNASRMDYPRYAANGWPLGSGLVESTCRLVCGLRCKQPGMRWTEGGVQNILSLRALLLSQHHDWSRLWQQHPQTRRPPVATLTTPIVPAA